MAKDLSYYVKKRERPNVFIDAPPGWVDDEGNRLTMEVRRMSAKEIADLRKYYEKKKPAKDGKRLAVQNGEVVHDVERDGEKWISRLVAESLVNPNIADKGFMEKEYGCFSKDEIAREVFSTNAEYTYMVEEVLKVQGMSGDEDEFKQDIDDAKN